jgi:hypothetical protein
MKKKSKVGGGGQVRHSLAFTKYMRPMFDKNGGGGGLVLK